MSEVVQISTVRDRKAWLARVRYRDAILLQRLEERFEIALHELAKEGGVSPDYLRRLMKQAAK